MREKEKSVYWFLVVGVGVGSVDGFLAVVRLTQKNVTPWSQRNVPQVTLQTHNPKKKHAAKNAHVVEDYVQEHLVGERVRHPILPALDWVCRALKLKRR